MPNISHVKLRITGRVQGVFYRHSTREKARSLGLSGWVMNTDDGAVEVEAHGASDMVDALIRWCHSGPPSAAVSSVSIEWQKEAEELDPLPTNFEIRS